ncbi:hypothetical protein HELRODRAFT_162385 [Helobdella robusta]|uniref:Uncharacterized protein n=1 Tax=Helobdella robusta TaxID=6412 RepID=T1ESL1_HELRO|nr:hypothetical protein HELRODRAFT_162385 [Helobdella robusta]ESN98916.1 hypothetical protein HELRODRAFT_162385 [Helobdella robusta]
MDVEKSELSHQNEFANIISQLESHQEAVYEIFNKCNKLEKSLKCSNEQLELYKENEIKLLKDIDELQNALRIKASNSVNDFNIRVEMDNIKNELELMKSKLKESNQLESKDDFIMTQQQDIEQMKIDFRDELNKYKVEMEDRLVKLQPGSNGSNSFNENQDIFRKKLLHEKQESDREKAGLKRKIQELEYAVQVLQSKKSGPPIKLSRKNN